MEFALPGWRIAIASSPQHTLSETGLSKSLGLLYAWETFTIVPLQRFPGPTSYNTASQKITPST